MSQDRPGTEMLKLQQSTLGNSKRYLNDGAFISKTQAPSRHWQATSLALLTSLSIGCHQAAPTASGPLTQRGYLWQRAWNSAVTDALTQAEARLDGVIILGAEIVWSGRIPQTTRTTIDWDTLKNSEKPVGIALRVAPFPGPFGIDD